MRNSTGSGGQAVVIGGSIAGVLAARVLSRHFERVTLVERDELPERPGPRGGVPQARHQHVMLLRGRRILERLFPGLHDELVARGAPFVDMASEMAWLTPAGWGARFPSDLGMLACSRDLLEWSVRRRLAQAPNVGWRAETDVAGLLPAEGGRAVSGVLLRSRRGGDTERLPADLVVDASGRGSPMPRWLEALGHEPPAETVVDARLGYASRVYERPGGGAEPIYVQPAPPHDVRGGVAFPLEGGRWIVTLSGMGGDYPPTDEAGFLAFARSLRSPRLFETIRDAQPLSPIAACRATRNRWRHYERLRRMPERLLVLGDAACAFNPVYAQGMTTAAVAAELLESCLARGLHGLGRRYQRRLARAHRVPWMLAVTEDLRGRETQGGRRDALTRFMHRYLDEVVRLTTRHVAVRRRLLETFHMVRSPASLFAPAVLGRVAARALRGRGRPVAAAPPEPNLNQSRTALS